MSFYHGIITDKLQETKQFYTEILSFAVKFENEWFVLLEKEEREVAFMLPGLKFQNELFRSAYGGGLWLTIEVEDVAAEYKRIQNSGIAIAVELRQEEWGETHFSIVDPNHIGIDFVESKTAETQQL